jgi:hypothetical protein
MNGIPERPTSERVETCLQIESLLMLCGFFICLLCSSNGFGAYLKRALSSGHS